MKWTIRLLVAVPITLFIALSPSSILPQETPTAWELYFSPHGGCTDAIIKELNKAKTSVLVQAYSFTSAPIAKALLNAHNKGVKVEVIMDNSQRTEKYCQQSRYFSLNELKALRAITSSNSKHTEWGESLV